MLRRRRLKPRITPRLHRKARTLAREAYIEAQGDAGKAQEIAQAKAWESYGDPATVWLILWIVAKIIAWWLENKITTPSESPAFGEPTFESGLDSEEQEDEETLWGEPQTDQPTSDYGPRGRLGRKDFASVAANMVSAQVFLIPASMTLERLADGLLPAQPQGVTFTLAYVGQSLLYLTFKTLSALLRHHGQSFIRSIAEWVWDKASEWFWSWFPFGKRARKRRREERRRRWRDRRQDRRNQQYMGAPQWPYPHPFYSDSSSGS